MSRRPSLSVISTQSITDSGVYSTSLGSSKNDKLRFLRKSPIKRAAMSFINLYSYLFSVLPIRELICKIMFFLRLFQFFIPSIFYSNKVLYPPNSVTYHVGMFLTIFTRLFPIGTDIQDQIVFGWIYVCFFAVYIIMISICSYYFSSKSTLPSFVPLLYTYTFTIIEHLPHCWALAAVGNIFSQNADDITNLQIITGAFIIVVFIAFSIIHQLLNVGSVFFTPMAFKTVYIWPQSAMTYVTAIICFLSEFSGNYDNKTIQIVLMCIVVLLYIFLFVIMEIYAYFLSDIQSAIFSAIFYGSVLFTIISLVYVILEKPIPDFMIVIVISSIIIFTITNSILQRLRILRSIRILDLLEENSENFAMFKRSKQLLPHIFTGYKVNHQSCLDYSIFREALNFFESDLSLLIAFAKLIAIYPEEYAQLSWIYTMVKKNPKKNYLTKFIKSQLLTILMRRESTLSTDLKKKLQSISNLVTTAKLRIRNTWEAVLSGTISELEPLFSSYSIIIKQIDLKFTYLQNYHSNNQYALRALANYEKEVQANYELANYHLEKARMIKIGHAEDVDQVFLYGRLVFPTMPSHPVCQGYRSFHQLPIIDSKTSQSNEDAVQINIPSISPSLPSSDSQAIPDDDEQLYNQDVQTRLRNSINSMALPSIRVSILITFLMVFIIMVVPYIALLILLDPIESLITDPIRYIIGIDNVHKYMSHIYGLVVHYIMESSPYNLTTMCAYPENWDYVGGVPESLGGDCHTDKILNYFAQQETLAMEDLSRLKMEDSTNEVLLSVKNILFQNITTFTYFQSFFVISDPVNKSIQQYAMDSVQTAIKISSSDNPIEYASSHEFVNLLINSFTFETLMIELTENLLRYLIDHTNQIKNIFTILEFALTIFFALIFIIVALILSKWMRNQRNKIYKCFYSIPKTTLSKMIESYSSSREIDDDSNESNLEIKIEAERQEGKALTILRSGDVGNRLSRTLGLFLIGILIIIINIIFIVYACEYFIQNSQTFIYSSPLLSYIGFSYCNAFNSLIFITIKAWMDNGFYHPAITNDSMISYFLLNINNSVSNYNKMFYGDSNENIYTTARFIDNFEQYETPQCDLSSEDIRPTINPSNEHTMYRCLSLSSTYDYFILSLKKLYYYYPMMNIPINLSSDEMYNSWHLILAHVYSNYLNPLINSISNSVQNVLTESKSNFILIITVLLIINLIITIFYVYCLFLDEKELKSTLLMLLHAPPNVILESSYIMSILSGDFSTRDSSRGQVDDATFTAVVDNYPDALLIFTSNGIILFKNTKALDIVGDKNLPKEIILNQTEFNINGRNFKATYTKIDSSKTMVILNDLSRNEALEKQIEEETKRRGHLFASLMPSIMANKLLSKSDNVSFSVQNVTVSMITIDFQDTNDNFIELFKRIYSRFNELIRNYQTIESVEVIGDVFMIVGGLYDEVNQSERHAKEVIQFSLEAIGILSHIKEEFNITNAPTLCGVATGGPVFAGIINLDIPTFEISGDIIDLAETMMVNASSDIIHTTRAVYELIYGGDFQIKERGDLTIPNFGTILTYFVSGKSK